FIPHIQPQEIGEAHEEHGHQHQASTRNSQVRSEHGRQHLAHSQLPAPGGRDREYAASTGPACDERTNPERVKGLGGAVADRSDATGQGEMKERARSLRKERSGSEKNGTSTNFAYRS